MSEGLIRAALKHASRADALKEISQATEQSISETGRGLDLTGAQLSELDLSDANLKLATLNRANLHGTKLIGANLAEASLICPGMERTNFSGANLHGAYVHALAAQVCKFDHADLSRLLDATGSLFHGCSMRGADLRGSQLAGAMFYQCDLSKSEFVAANLQGSAINECVLVDTSFVSAEVSQLTITKCRMNSADFGEANGEGLTIQRTTGAMKVLFNGAHLPSLRLLRVNGSVDMSGLSAENFSAVECGLRDSLMDRFSGRCAIFRDCDLSDSYMRHAYLYRAMLTGDPPSGMSLRNVRMDGANLVQAYIAADLTNASLRSAKMAYARLNQSIFDNADLSGSGSYEASMVKTSFVGAKLVAVSGPFFADRCTGLEDALREAHNDDGLRCAEQMKVVAKIGRGGST